jgi:hypothetical protein
MQLTMAEFLVAWALAGGVSIGVFLHANRHGVAHATAWASGVFLFLGLVLPLYIFRYRRRDKSGRRY